VMQNFQKRFLGECVDNNGRHLTDTIFKKWILQLKCFEIKFTLAVNSLKKIVHFSFYFNLKIVKYFCRTLYIVLATFRQETGRLSGTYVCELALLPMITFIDHFPRMQLCHGYVSRCHRAQLQ
jgi:hypothetical protein